jgi:3-hydroxyisobutyrate dehydrogenase-like beta-hydroxyacid dehydrogenase
MGGPVARRILEAGFHVLVLDRNPNVQRGFVELGATAGDSPAQIARESDVVIAALPTPEDVHSVALGEEGVRDGIREDGIFADISTCGPETIQEIASALRPKGAWAVDAPVSAGQPGSPPGVHEVMVGGPRVVFDRLLPVLAAFGDQIIHTGGVGTASVCKVAHQVIGAGVAQSIAEGLTLAVKAGVEPQVVWEAVRRGLIGRMQVLHEEVPYTVFSGNYEPGIFTTTLLSKDVGLGIGLGQKYNVPLPVSSVVQQMLLHSLNQGWGSTSGYAVSCRLQEQASGVSLRCDGVDPREAGSYISTHGPSFQEVPVAHSQTLSSMERGGLQQ